MSVLDYIVLLFALRTCLVVWFQEDLTAELRATAQAYADSEVIRTWRYLPYNILTLYGGLWKAITCPFCASHHFGAVLATLAVCCREGVSWWLIPLGIAYGWAAGEILLLLERTLPPDMRYTPVE